MSASMTMWKFRSNLLAFLGHAFLLLFAPGNMYVALVGAAVCPPDGNSTAWVDCRNGVAFESGASTGTTCKDACGGQCCFDSVYPSSEAPCLNATACIKKDGSCNGDDACKSLALYSGGKPVISGPSCVGPNACLRLGYNATAVPDFITDSCVRANSCGYLGEASAFGNVLSSCNGDNACNGLCAGTCTEVSVGSLNGSCNIEVIGDPSECSGATITTPQACKLDPTNNKNAGLGVDCFVDTNSLTPLTPDGICDGAGQCVNMPSAAPSDVPSNVPSTSSTPSSAPSLSSDPSSQPSKSPSDMPSDEPSSDLSTSPSSGPSPAPSEAPSAQSSSTPTDSLQPSPAPSDFCTLCAASCMSTKPAKGSKSGKSGKDGKATKASVCSSKVALL